MKYCGTESKQPTEKDISWSTEWNQKIPHKFQIWQLNMSAAYIMRLTNHYTEPVLPVLWLWFQWASAETIFQLVVFVGEPTGSQSTKLSIKTELTTQDDRTTLWRYILWVDLGDVWHKKPLLMPIHQSTIEHIFEVPSAPFWVLLFTYTCNKKSKDLQTNKVV